MLPLRKWHNWAVANLAAAAVLFGGGVAQAQPAGEGIGAQAAAIVSEDDFILLQLQIKKYRMQNDLRGYRTQGGVCMDLADMIQALDLGIRLDKKSRRATGWLFSEDRTFQIDRDSNTVQNMNTTRQIQPGELIDTPEGWCVDTNSLAGWMGVELKPDLYDAVLVLDFAEPLPFIQALERKSRAARLRPDRDRRDLSAYPQAPQPYKLWSLPSVDVVARASYRESAGRGQFTQRYEIFASGEAARVSYDMRLASDSEGVPDTLRVRGFRKDPDAAMLGPLRATQIAGGDVEILSGNLAGAGGVGRGGFISNRALDRPTRFGSTVLRGALPLGWDAELYRNGQLLAFQNAPADGRYEFEVSLVYGQNDLEVVLYGPQGQVRRERQSIPVGFGAISPGKLEYWAGIIQRNRDLINFGGAPPVPGQLETGWQYAAGLQYGLGRRTVVGANGHSLFLDGRRRDYTELNLQRSVGPMLLNLTAAQELGRGRAYRTDIIGRIGKINVQMDSYFVDGGYTSGLVSEEERSAHRLQFDTSLKIGRVPVPISGGLRRSTQRDGQKINELLARGSLIMPRLALTGFVLHRDTENAQGGEDGTRVGLLANTRIAGIGVRGEGTYRLSGPKQGFDTASVTLERALDEQSELRLEVEHSAQFDQTDFELGYVRFFRDFAVRGGAQIGSNGALGANVAVGFSLGRDPLSGGVRFSREKLAQRGHAAVSVFLDQNGDGIRSADEAALEGVEITAGQRSADAPTDENGHAFVEGLSPYQKVLIHIDESTLPDPFLMPRGKGVVVTPRPGVPAVLEIAVAPTGEVEGIIIGPEGTPLAGVEVELIDSDGLFVARTMSEYDGFFLFDRVPFGNYSLRLTEDSAAALGAARMLRSGIALNGGHTLERMGNLRLNDASPSVPNLGSTATLADSPPAAAVAGPLPIDSFVTPAVSELPAVPLTDWSASHTPQTIGGSSEASNADRGLAERPEAAEMVVVQAMARSSIGEIRPADTSLGRNAADQSGSPDRALAPDAVGSPAVRVANGASESAITEKPVASPRREDLGRRMAGGSAPANRVTGRASPSAAPVAALASGLVLACLMFLWKRRRNRARKRRGDRIDPPGFA